MRREIINTNGLELSDQVVTIKRVSKTVKGGRTMRFTALVVVGDKNGHVGVGLGKATEIPDAIRKGREDATKHLTTIAMDEVQSVPHDYIGKFGLDLEGILEEDKWIREHVSDYLEGSKG